MLRTTAHVTASVLMAACGNTVSSVADDGNAVSVTLDTILVKLDRLSALRTIDSAYVLPEQQMVILRVGERDYRVFTNICTHAGCGIYLFQQQRLRCQCHGSEFDVDGASVAGPALLPLRRYAVTLSDDTRELWIARN